jgi:hypothetical protein
MDVSKLDKIVIRDDDVTRKKLFWGKLKIMKSERTCFPLPNLNENKNKIGERNLILND